MLQAPGNPAELEDQKVPDLSCILSFFLVAKSARLVMHFGSNWIRISTLPSFVCLLHTNFALHL